MNQDLNTQDIYEATQSADDGSLFFLLVATPKNPPKSIHKKLIHPYLHARGWKKISYKQTGFRALYFFYDQEIEADSQSLIPSPMASYSKCRRCQGSADDDKISESHPKRQRVSEAATQKHAGVAFPTQCYNCEGWSSSQRANYDRLGLKKEIEKYKEQLAASFEVHVVLSRPVDSGEEFMEIASQPDAIEHNI